MHEYMDETPVVTEMLYTHVIRETHPVVERTRDS
jgi:hypothetical protein